MKKWHYFFISTFLLISCSANNTSLFLSSSGCEHLIVIDQRKEPTCYEIGLTEGKHCAKCNLIIEKQEIIPPSHNYKLTNIYLEKVKDITKAGDFKCARCQNKIIKEISFEDINIPIITIEGNLNTINKENKTKLKITYQDKKKLESIVTFKLQGSSSLAYPKKNYNIQFLDENGDKQKVLLNENWSKQSKYCLKANYIDYSQARNVVSAKIYGDIVHYRNLNDEINNLVNGGAIDGYPVLIYNNDNYLGLYTLNIPKDKWLFNMKDKKPNSILMAKEWSKSCFLQEEINENFSNGWEVEYCGNDDINSLRNNFNKVINEIKNNDFSHIYVDRAIDSMLYTMLIGARDNYSKNILWASFDGSNFLPSVYDLDATWGINWDGKSFSKYNEYLINDILSSWNCNELWKKLFQNYPLKIASSYFSLREGPLKLDNILNKYNSFISSIDKVIYQTESKKWPNIPSQKENNIVQIESYIVQRINLFDKYFKEMENAYNK